MMNNPIRLFLVVMEFTKLDSFTFFVPQGQVKLMKGADYATKSQLIVNANTGTYSDSFIFKTYEKITYKDLRRQGFLTFKKDHTSFTINDKKFKSDIYINLLLKEAKKLQQELREAKTS